MKLTSINLFSNNAQVAKFSFRDPGATNPYAAIAIEGLDADEIVPKFYGLGSSNERFYTLSVGSREPVIKIALNPQFTRNKTYSDLRDDLYRAIASSRTGEVTLVFRNGAVDVAAISGQINKFEAKLSDPEPHVQITIKCRETMLKGVVPWEVDIGPLTQNITVNDATSTSPHGVTFDMTFTAVTTTLTVRDSATPSWSFSVTPGTLGGLAGFRVGDKLHFSSEQGVRSLYITRGATIYYIVDKITPGSIWPIVFPGANDFEFLPAASFTWDAITYYPTYWGV